MIFLNSLLDSGTPFVDPPSQKRSGQLSNQISLALFIALVQPSVLTDEITRYRKGIEEALPIPGIAVRYFSTREDAREWIKSRKRKSNPSKKLIDE
jgi:hypothetical protein